MSWRVKHGEAVSLGLVAAVSGVLMGCQPHTTTEGASVLRPVRSMVVSAQPVQAQPVLSGLLQARHEIRAGFRLAGKLQARLVNPGDHVQRGQLLARLDGATEQDTRTGAQAEWQAAQAVLEQAQRNEQRLARLVGQQAVSHAAYEDAVRQLKTAREQVSGAKARLDASRKQVDYTRLLAEESGLVTSTLAEPGEVLAAGQPVLVLASDAGRDGVFAVPAALIHQGMAVGQSFALWQAEQPAQRVQGTVREVAPQADPYTRTYAVKVSLHQPPASWLLGAPLLGQWQQPAQRRMLIPSSALLQSEGKPAVWVVDPTNQRVQARPVRIDRYTDQQVIVADGLRDGERIVTAGSQTLHADQPVRLLEAAQ